MPKQAQDVFQHAAGNIAIITTDVIGNVTAFNSGAEELSGYLSQEILNNPAPIKNLDAIKQSLNGQNKANIKAELQHKAGHLIEVELTASIINSKQDADSGLLLMVTPDKSFVGSFEISQLHNGEVFTRVLEREFFRMQRHQQAIALIKVDIDHYKAHQQTYGHDKTQRCVTQIAYTLNSRVQRAGDFLAYMGHDEFMILLPNTDKPGSVKMAEYLRLLVAALEIEHNVGDNNDIVTVSLGLAHLVPTKDNKPEELLAIAENGLRQAKADGRNCSRIGNDA